jgi:tetratricopeptide (TPR) repeat protein
MLFLNYLASLVVFLTTAARSGNQRTSSSTTTLLLFDAKMTTYEVCLSPGCVADGAESTLLKMQALAPPNLCVQGGVCCSLCGNGPVVFGDDNKKHRKVSETKLLSLLYGEEGLNGQQEAVLEAFNVVVEADAAMKSNDCEKAVALYEKGLCVGMQAALDLEEARRNNILEMIPEEPPSSLTPPGLLWLIKARKNEAAAKLNLGDQDGAILSARSACDLSGNASPEAFELLHEAYQAKGDTKGEMETLRYLFALPSESEKLSTMQANKGAD